MNNFEQAKNLIKNADAILITASNGLSIAEGYHIFADNDDFKKYFDYFRKRYGIPNLISGVFAQIPQSEHEKYMLQVRKYLIEDYAGSEVMKNLLKILKVRHAEFISASAKNKNYFIITTNGDTHFQINGFDKNKIFEAEGNFARTQMESPEWKNQFKRFQNFVSENADKKLLIWELGVGKNNQFLKKPIMNLFLQNPNWNYLAMNLEKDIVIPFGQGNRSVAICGDIAENLKQIAKEFYI